MPRFKRGLVVGKFSPLHKGHEALISRAKEECGEVVLISYANPERPGCGASRRREWVSALFPGLAHWAVTDEAPPDDADETVHRKFCADLCLRFLGGPVDAVFTGEAYGDGFALELSRQFGRPVTHVRIDRTPPSASKIRQDVHAHRSQLSPIVYASFVRRVALLGGESTGKSTLAAALARAFNTRHVDEFGRELWEAKRGRLAFEDMLHIAQVQVRREEDAAPECDAFLFCDSTPLTTLFYCSHGFGRADPALERLAERKYDLTLLCMPDFPFVQDGTRQREDFRMLQHDWYVDELSRRGIAFEPLGGSVEERLRTVASKLARLNPR